MNRPTVDGGDMTEYKVHETRSFKRLRGRTGGPRGRRLEGKQPCKRRLPRNEEAKDPRKTPSTLIAEKKKRRKDEERT